jgi:thiamine-phosphate pyrophosphorylase
VTDRRQARHPLTGVVAAALAAGCRWVSLGEKDLPADEQILLARALMPMVHAQAAKLMLHGEASVARAAGADGVHLASGAMPPPPAPCSGRENSSASPSTR